MYGIAVLNAVLVLVAVLVMLVRTYSPRTFGKAKALLKVRRGSMGGAGTVLTLIVIGTVIVIGAVVFTKEFTVLDSMRDADFSAEANATIAGVNTDFWSGLDLTRVLMILLPASAILGAIFYYLLGSLGASRGV